MSPFPSTRRFAVAGLRSPDPAERTRSFESIIAAYWKPAYKYLRVRWGGASEEAQDLVQGFFLRAMEKDLLAGFDPAKGRFRTFLKVCLDGYVANEEKAARRLKRGGDAVMLPLDFETAEGELRAARMPSPDSIDRYFETEWVRGLFEMSVSALRDDCLKRSREVPFRLFERYDLLDSEERRPSYANLASEYGIPVTTVTNHLALARREFRRIVLEKLREITASDEEFRREARDLLGAEPGSAC